MLRDAAWIAYLRTVPVYCLMCGRRYEEAGLPTDWDYPLTNGICPDCRRIIRRPNYALVTENEQLRQENERLREALRSIVGLLSPLLDGEPSVCDAEDVYEIAKAALDAR